MGLYHHPNPPPGQIWQKSADASLPPLSERRSWKNNFRRVKWHLYFLKKCLFLQKRSKSKNAKNDIHCIIYETRKENIFSLPLKKSFKFTDVSFSFSALECIIFFFKAFPSAWTQNFSGWANLAIPGWRKKIGDNWRTDFREGEGLIRGKKGLILCWPSIC